MLDTSKLSRTANLAADYYNELQTHRHRGVDNARDGRLIFFGNDCYRTDERSKKECEWLAGELDAYGVYYQVGLSDSGMTWVIIARDEDGYLDEDEMNEELWNKWLELSEQAAAAKGDTLTESGVA